MNAKEQRARTAGRLAFMDASTHNPYKDRLLRRCWQQGRDEARAEQRALPEFRTPDAVIGGESNNVLSKLKDWANREMA